MRKIALMCSLCLVLAANGSRAAFASDQSSAAAKDLPAVILSGFDAYKTNGADSAVKAWIKDSPIDGSKAALTQANNLHQVEDYYGAYKGFETVRVRDISPKIKVLYLTIDYEKGPLFGKFVVYRAEHGWLLTSFLFNTEAEKVFPSDAAN